MTHSARLVLVAALAGALVAAGAVTTALAQSPKRGDVFRLPAPDAVSLDPHDPGFTTQAGMLEHPPYVKGFKHIDGLGLGTRLMYVWIDR